MLTCVKAAKNIVFHSCSYKLTVSAQAGYKLSATENITEELDFRNLLSLLYDKSPILKLMICTFGKLLVYN